MPIKPKPKKIPAKVPTMAPSEPALEPPDFAVKIVGTKLFTTSTITVMTAQTMRVTSERLQELTKYEARRAHQHKGVPKRPGIMQPMMPRPMSKTVTTISKISIGVIGKL